MVVKKKKKRVTSARGKVFVNTFIRQCVAFIIDDPGIRFMDREAPDVTVKKFGTIAATLLGVCEVGILPSAAPPADPVAAALTQFLKTRPWPPVGRTRPPAAFASMRPHTLRRIEVSEILDRLLERVNDGSGGGGGGSDWPPHVRT